MRVKMPIGGLLLMEGFDPGGSIIDERPAGRRVDATNNTVDGVEV